MWRIEQVLIISKRKNARYKNIEINLDYFQNLVDILSSIFLHFLKAKFDPSDVDLIHFWKIQTKAFSNFRKFAQKYICGSAYR